MQVGLPQSGLPDEELELLSDEVARIANLGELRKVGGRGERIIVETEGVAYARTSVHDELCGVPSGATEDEVLLAASVLEIEVDIESASLRHRPGRWRWTGRKRR